MRLIGARHRALQPVGLERVPLAAHAAPANRARVSRGSRGNGGPTARGCRLRGFEPAAGGRVQVEVEPGPLHRHVERIEEGLLAAQQRRERVTGADAPGLERGDGPGSGFAARAHPLEFETGEDGAPDLRDRGVEAERLAQRQDDERLQQGPRNSGRQEHEGDPAGDQVTVSTGHCHHVVNGRTIQLTDSPSP